jgi:uncharacterized DUF497 family protein
LSRVTIYDFAIDDENREKFASHGLSARRVLQVLENEFEVVPNRKRRAARYLVIGRDNGGTCIAIPVTPTHDRTLWRPVTAWPCKESEEAVLDRKGK